MQGSSQRGPSLKVPFDSIRFSDSSYLLKSGLTVRRPSSTSHTSDSGYDSCASPTSESKIYDLFVPAPSDLSKERAYNYHVTTRNYFAFINNQALVGEKLGLALIELHERTQEWHSGQDLKPRLLSYCEQQGYLGLAENVAYATAILNFAEKTQFQELWTNSFAHCVGMHDRLDMGPDYHELSNMTRALITRASLEMDLHVSRAMRAIGSFLEEELGTDRLGLAKPARAHLDRFRCFLHSHYMERLGYFPPNHAEAFNKKLLDELHADFQSLYDLLADTSSDGTMNNESNASGGVCCLQNTSAFDQRHRYEPLPHPSPLLPSIAPARQSIDAQRSLRTLKLGRSTSTTDAKLPPKMALALATNAKADELTDRPLVTEYRRFERLRMEEKITVHEGRKVRWLLIYGVLQMLKSIKKAPKGVEGIEASSYPLCVLTAGSPDWQQAEDEDTPEATPNGLLEPGEDAPRPESEGRISIHPDCEADNAAEYFTNSRRSSFNALDMTPPPLRINYANRSSALRTSVSSGVNALQRSFSLVRRNSSRKSLQGPKHRRMGSYEIVAPGYGNGIERKETSQNEALADLEGDVFWTPGQRSMGTTHNPWQEFDFGLQNVAEEPTMDDRHLDQSFGLDHLRMTEEPGEETDGNSRGSRNSWNASDAAFTTHRSASDEPVSATTYSSNSDSLRSSYLGDECETPISIYSSPSESPICSPRASLTLSKPTHVSMMQQSTHPRRSSLVDLQPGWNKSGRASLNAGCYCPSGSAGSSSMAPRSRFSQYLPQSNLTPLSDASQGADYGFPKSEASSLYEPESRQADEREAESVRGRRRTRISDAFAGFSFGR